jgi:hypothetical protein
MIVSVLAFAPAYWDHGETWGEIKASKGKEKVQKLLKLFVLWAIPILSLIGTVFLGVESVSSDRQSEKSINDVAAAKQATTDLKIAIEPRAAKVLRNRKYGLALLTPFAGISDTIESVEDSEVNDFIFELNGFLSECGWTSNITGMGIFRGIPPHDVLIVSNMHNMQAASALSIFLDDCGIKSGLKRGDNESNIYILIGAKTQ